MSKVLWFGDIFARPGRQALAKVLPQLILKHEPDLVIANVENLAHGKGVTKNTLDELHSLGVEVFTSGNHIFDKPEQLTECFEKYDSLIRPANYHDSLVGRGFTRVHKGNNHYLIINLSGKVFFDEQSGYEIINPFLKFDQILQNESQKDDIILVDMHAEATSEKAAFGWYADGRISAFAGTHTHIPTADARILPKGTAYISDIGMTGPRDSVIGVEPQVALNMFLEKDRFRMKPAESSVAEINAVLLDIEDSRVSSIQSINMTTEI